MKLTQFIAAGLLMAGIGVSSEASAQRYDGYSQQYRGDRDGRFDRRWDRRDDRRWDRRDYRRWDRRANGRWNRHDRRWDRRDYRRWNHHDRARHYDWRNHRGF